MERFWGTRGKGTSPAVNHGLSEALSPAPTVGLFLVLAVLAACSAGVALADAPDHSGAVLTNAANSTAVELLRIVYFHSPSCHDCLEVKRALPGILRQWGSQIRLERRSVEDMAVFNELFKYEEHYGVQVGAPPVVFVGSQYLVGPKAIVGQLDRVIAEELAKGTATFIPPTAQIDKAVAEQA